MPDYNLAAIKRQAFQMGVPVHHAIEARIRYLCQEIEDYCEIAVGDGLAYCFASMALDEIIALKESFKKREERPRKEDGITDEMVEAARSFPVNQLIDFNRSGFALAWCHPDRTPSLRHFKQANRAYCFPCQKSFDSIAILMDRDGRTFQEAVRELQ